MKRGIIYIVFVCLVTFSNQFYAQDSTKAKTAEDVINIKELVDQQIREIQESEEKKNSENVENTDNTENAGLLISDQPVTEASNEPTIEIETEKAEIITVSEDDTPLIKDIYIKIIIGVESLLLLLIIYFWYKKKSKAQRSEIYDLKKNIKRLREEKIGGLLDNSLTKVRSKLVLQVANIDSRNITSQARKLSISKGELHLAAKINLMSRQA